MLHFLWSLVKKYTHIPHSLVLIYPWVKIQDYSWIQEFEADFPKKDIFLFSIERQPQHTEFSSFIATLIYFQPILSDKINWQFTFIL